MNIRNNNRFLAIGVIFLLAFIAVSSCEPGISPNLKEIDCSINKDYKRAELALDSMEHLGLPKGKSNYMYSKLLRIKIADKAYQPIKRKKREIDSLVNYFEDQKDADALAQAYYLAGRVNSDLGDSPKSLILYQKAEEAANKDNYALQGDIYCQMGYIYKENHLYQDAITSLQKAYLMDSLSNNHQNMLFDIRDIGINYRHLGNTDTAKLYFLKGYNKSIYTNEFMSKNFAHQLAVVYIEQKNYSKAKEYLRISLKDLEDFDTNKSGIYATAYKLYGITGEEHLSKPYESWLLQNGTIWAKMRIYQDLLSKSIKHTNNKNLINLWDKYNLCSDSAYKISDTEAIKRIEQIYNYNLKEKENEILHNNNLFLSLAIFCLAITLISIIAICIMAYSNFKQKQKNLKLRLEKYETLRKSSEQKNEEKIEDENNACINSEIYRKIKDEIETDSYQLNEEDWKELEETVNEIYPKFSNNLNSFYEVSPHELRVCLLIKIGISPSNIAKFTNHSKEAINSTRGRLYAKVFNKPASAPKWDEFLKTI